MNPDPRDQIEAMQPRKGALLLLIPVGMVALTFVLYAVTLALGLYGHPAAGERVRLAFTSCAAARPVVAHRVEGMGLGEPVFTDTSEGFVLEVTLPADPRIAQTIPQTLVRPGRLSGVRHRSPEVLVADNTHVAAASVRQDLTMIPWTVITLNAEGVSRLQAFVAESREGKVEWSLDGEALGAVSNLKGAGAEVELTPSGEDDRDRLEKAAERAIVLASGPLPCPATVTRAPAPPAARAPTPAG